MIIEFIQRKGFEWKSPHDERNEFGSVELFHILAL